MKLLIPVISLTLIVLLPGCASKPQRQTTLLPGLTYYSGPETISGKFVFLYAHNEQRSIDSNNDTSASLYEFDIAGEKLNKLADCPDGQLVDASQDGLCVIYRLGVYSDDAVTNAFIYSTKMHQHRNVTLDGVPRLTCIVDGHVFFELEGVNYKSTGRYMITNGGYSGSKIVDYNISGNRMQTVELPGASVWKFTQYDGIYRPRGQTSILLFHYNAYGNRLTEGKNYPEGSYIVDVESGETRNAVGDYAADERCLLTAYDGHRIIFLGGQSEMGGLELVSTEANPPYGEGETITLPPGKYKLLRSFSKSFDPRRDEYVLHGMSPDRRYVLVMKVHADESSSTDEIHSYYLVDVTNGNTRLLLKDATGVGSRNYIKPSIYWVDGSN